MTPAAQPAIVEAAIAAVGGHQPRREIVALFCAEAHHFLSAQQFYLQMRGRGARVALTTVYHSLRALTEAGYAHSVHDEDSGTVLFVLRYGDEDIARCRHCAAAIRFAPLDTATLAGAVQHRTGLDEITYDLHATGRCPQCQNLPSPRSARQHHTPHPLR